MKTTRTDEPTKARTDVVVERDPSEFADAAYRSARYINDYSTWRAKEFELEPNVFLGIVTHPHRLSWAAVQDSDVLTQQISYGNIARSAELVSERLRQQLGAVFGYSQRFDEIKGRLSTLTQLLETVNAKIDQLAGNISQSASVTLVSFVPESLEVASPINILIAPEADGFQASFLDANLHAYGETKEEALFNIKATIVETFQRLVELSDNQLGRSMLRQKQILTHHLRQVHTD